MLDYTVYLKNYHRFILNYEIVDDNIVIHYANEEDYIIPYSKDMERVLLVFMRNQVLDFSDKFSKVKDEYLKFDNFFPKCACGVTLAYSIFEQQFFAFLLSAFFGGLIVFRNKSHDKDSKLLEDYDKNKFFVENEEKFLEFGKNITLNDLDRYSKEELVSMLYMEESYTFSKVKK